MQVTGNVQRITTRQAGRGTATNIQVNGQWYGCGFNGVPCQEGDVIQFTATQNGQYWNADVRTIQVLSGGGGQQQQAPAQQRQQQGPARAQGGNARASSGGSRDAYWEKKEERDVITQKVIQLQASRNSAIAVCSAAVSAGILPLPTKKADAFDAFLAAVDEVTARFERDAANKAAGNAVFDAEVVAQPDRNEPDFDDDIPF